MKAVLKYDSQIRLSSAQEKKNHTHLLYLIHLLHRSKLKMLLNIPHHVTSPISISRCYLSVLPYPFPHIISNAGQTLANSSRQSIHILITILHWAIPLCKVICQVVQHICFQGSSYYIHVRYFQDIVYNSYSWDNHSFILLISRYAKLILRAIAFLLYNLPQATCFNTGYLPQTYKCSHYS